WRFACRAVADHDQCQADDRNPGINQLPAFYAEALDVAVAAGRGEHAHGVDRKEEPQPGDEGDHAGQAFTRIMRAFSRSQSRFFSVSRLSNCFLPLASPTESLIRPLE